MEKKKSFEPPYFCLQPNGAGNKEALGTLYRAHDAECVSEHREKNVETTVWNLKRCPVSVTVTLESFEGTSAVRQTTSVRNIGSEPVALDQISSFYRGGIGAGGILPWYDEERFAVHFCESCWQGEGQWRSATLEELGLYPTSTHWCLSEIRFSSTGSWSTSRYYPLIMIEDKECKSIWYFELEAGYQWSLSIGNVGDSLYVEGNSAYIENDGCRLSLAPGESFTSSSGVFGCTDGGFEEAVRDLTIYKRRMTKAKAFQQNLPAIYNNYMNGTWGTVRDDILKPIVDACADAGMEVFCIDAGWNGLPGDWDAQEEKFGADGFQGMIHYIQSKGMKAGAWLEIESIHPKSKAFADHPDWLLTRDGVPLGSGMYFVDFRKQEVCDHIRGIIRGLYDRGIRFIKNDYNQSTGLGCDPMDKGAGLSQSMGLIESARAFYAFIDDIKREFPDLLIENCGSGAMRSDNETLSHFDLPSTSDQERCFRNPSLIAGSLALMPPEKAGIWAYPYPLYYDVRQKPYDDYFTAERLASYADGEETIFNLVGALCGCMYLSGQIQRADDKNRALIQQAVSVYKRYRDHTTKSYPVFPLGFLRLNQKGYQAIGLVDRAAGLMTLAVFRVYAPESHVSIDLSKWAGEKSSARLVYPESDEYGSYRYYPDGAKLAVRFPKELCARFFEIRL